MKHGGTYILLILFLSLALYTRLDVNWHCLASDDMPTPTFHLYGKGKEKIVDYKKYGQFNDIGTKDYSYKITDKKGLSKAVGEGIYPNISVFKDPEYNKLKNEKKLEGSHWDFINIDDQRLAFYKWASTGEEAGLKQFYTARALEMSNNIEQAIKGYYSIVVNFPRSWGLTYWKTPWYVATAAIDKVYYLTWQYPQLGEKLVGPHIKIEGGYDADTSNDIFTIMPGQIISCKPTEVFDKKIDLNKMKIIKRNETGRIEIVQYENGHWQLFVGGKPFIIKGMSYNPNKIGQSPDEGTLDDWMQADYNHTGKIAAPYEAWVDTNKNNVQDPDEKPVGDFQLMKKMGVNVVRIYHHASNKELLRDLYKSFGIMVIMGDFLGVYTTGSGASWYRGTDYLDPVQKENMKSSVRQMVLDHKDEPYILAWVLGNENNYGVANNSRRHPHEYYAFVNEVAKMIKEIDKEHPVILCNGDVLFLDIIAKECPDIDIFGCNSYRGEYGFCNTIWQTIKDVYDRPVLITEYGCQSYIDGKSQDEAEDAQAQYHQGAWMGIARNTAGYGVGNAIGGVVFEWMDEWWKAYGASEHDTRKLWIGPFPGGYMYEEWCGVTSQGDGSNSPYLRQFRKAYYMYQKLWRE